MSDNGIKQEDEHLRDRDDGGDDEVRVGFSYHFLLRELDQDSQEQGLMQSGIGGDFCNEETGRGDGG